MGDSVSAGWMAKPGEAGFRFQPEQGYAKHLSTVRGPIVNTAVAGHTSSDLLREQVPRSGITSSYTGYGAVVIMAGINDANLKVSNEVTVRNVIQLVQGFRVTPFCRPQVLVVSPPWFYASTYFNSESAALQATLGPQLSRAVADLRLQGYSVGYLDLYSRSRQMASSYYCSGFDGHPCEAGHLDMAQQISQKLAYSF
jgi:lysophospholipase L1-like esterase